MVSLILTTLSGEIFQFQLLPYLNEQFMMPRDECFHFKARIALSNEAFHLLSGKAFGKL
jgi:hypothetical protein